VARHYLKILRFLESYARQVSGCEVDWATGLFNDLTESGKKISVVPLPPNQHGPRIQLCGDVFVCEAGIDRDREDTLFVSRVESAEARLPREVPEGIAGEFRLLGGKAPSEPDLDSVRYLFAEPAETGSVVAAQARPSPTLLKALSNADEEVRVPWRPGTDVPEIPTDAFIAHARELWSRYRLDRFASLSQRWSIIFSRQLTPRSLSQKDRHDLVSPLDVSLLNSFAAKERGAQTVALTRELADFPLPEGVRASVWSAILSGLDHANLRRELHAASSGLRSLPVDSRVIHWSEPVLDALEGAAGPDGDERLLDEVQAARSENDPLLRVAKWAAGLQYSEARASAVSTTSTAAPARPSDAQPLPTSVQDQSTEVQPQADDTGLSPEVRTAIEAWVVRLRLGEESVRAELTAEARMLLGSVSVSVVDLADLAALRTMVRDLDKLRHSVDRLQAQLPSGEQLDQDFDEAAAAYLALTGSLGDHKTIELIRENPTPSVVLEIAALLSRLELIEALPDWLWGEDTSTPDQLTDFSIASRLLTTSTRENARLLAATATDFGLEDLSPLQQIPRPPDDVDLEMYASQCIRASLEDAAAIQRIPDDYRCLLEEIDGGTPSPAEVLQWVDILEDLRDRVSDEAFSAILSKSAGFALENRTDLLDRFAGAIRFFESHFGSAIDATIAQLENWISRQAREATASADASSIPMEFELEHNWTARSGARARLSIDQSDGQPYGWIDLPFAIYARRAMDVSFHIDLEFRGQWRDAWPTSWPSPEPLDIQIPRSDWRTLRDDDRKVKTVTLRIPVRVPRTGSTSFECLIGLSDRSTGATSAVQKKLAWDQIMVDRAELAVRWPEGIAAHYVEDHPIGPQKGIKEIEERIAEGSPFAVVAPRRFGKSTLIRYLQEHHAENGWVVPEPIACTSYFDGSRLAYDELWADLSEGFQSVVGSGLSRAESSEVPGPDAFRHLLKTVSAAGKPGLLILVDEAQLLFPASGGHVIGDLFKDRLERSWSAASTGRPPVVFGFVGLPTLLDRAGANLSGLLRPIEEPEMDQADLNRLLLEVTGKMMDTTREARQRLVETASNLFLLRTLIQKLVALLNTKNRSWANFDDVVHVESELIADLETGSARAVGQWIRDALNDAETVNQWRPSRAYPVALAVAAARKEGARAEREIRDRVQRILQDWCGSHEDGTLEHLSFGPAQLDEHLRILNENQILDGVRFRSRLMEAWLAGEGRNGYPTEAIDALVKSAYRSVRIPEGAEPVGDGGQAKIFRFHQDGVQMALRKIELLTVEERSRFIESAQTLDLLIRGEHRAESGAQYIFDLTAMGFASDDEMAAVQVYRWIDGRDLSEKLGQLTASMIAEIGLKLAQAIELLHSNGIIHRDIQPKNVILAQEKKRPVLIDFGMARLESPDMKTQVASPYAAPEVRTDPPHWTKAADIYSIGILLQRLWREDDRGVGSLTTVIERASAKHAEDRPSAGELVRELRRAQTDLEVRSRADAFWNVVSNAASSDSDKYWYRAVLDSFKSNFEAISLGILFDEFEKSAEIADFLNQVLEAFPLKKRSESLSLGRVKHRNDHTGDELRTREIDFLHQVRNWLRHGEKKEQGKEKILRKFNQPEPNELRRIAQKGARQVASCLNVSSLSAVVEAILDE